MSSAEELTYDLGSLPKSDRNAELQRLSFKALGAALPANRFVLRDERSEDAGVDASIELLYKSYSTNIRSCLQLKSTDDNDLNKDGSYSLQVSTSNLNYLLNGPSPLYIIYIAPRDELRFIWALDEFRRFERTDRSWRDQSKITLRFERILTSEALEEIYERVLREGRVCRKVLDVLAQASLTEQIVIGVDAKTLEVTKPSEVEKLLIENGFTLVATGNAVKVVDHLRLIDAEAAQAPRIQLVQAYAQTARARYATALGHIQEASLRGAELEIADRQFLKYLRDFCEYQTGRVDLEEYSRREREWAGGHGDLARAHRLDIARHEFLSEMDMSRRAERFERVRAVAAELLADAESSSLRVLARLVLLDVTGSQATTTIFQSVIGIPMRRALSLTTDIDSLKGTLLAGWGEWERSMNATFADAEVHNQPLLTAYALNVRVALSTGRLIILCLLGEVTGEIVEVPEDLRLEAMSGAEQAMSIYERAGQLEGALRSKIQLADLYHIIGQKAAANSLASDALPKAEAMGYETLKERATEHLENNTLLDRLRSHLDHALSADIDVGLANMSDDEARAFALDVATELKVPGERLPNLERDAFASRDGARQRLWWCRHLSLLQDLTHTSSLATIYKDALKYDGGCDLYGYKTDLGITDWQHVLAEFKNAYCANCPSREPKVVPSKSKAI